MKPALWIEASTPSMKLASDWWHDINESTLWQDGVFYFLCLAYALVSSIALVQLIRIQLRVPDFGWTTQKVFHFMNFVVNGVRAVVFGFHVQVFLFRPKVFTLTLLDLPGLLFFSTYTLLVLFWAEIYHQAKSLPTDKLRVFYFSINIIVYIVQILIWMYLWIDNNNVVDQIGKIFIAAISLFAAIGFLVYGGRLFFLLRLFPIESKGRRKKLNEVGSVTAICFTCFLIRCVVAPVHAGNGEFLMELAVGTPRVNFSAIVDTGSDLIWTQCKPCLECFEQPTPVFDPAKSSSYSNLSCTDRLCLALPTAACSAGSGSCGYLYAYGDSSSTQGVLATETFSIGAPEPTAVPKVAFGCGEDNQGDGFSQGGGLVGLGRGPLSLISQLNLTRFSYCLTSLDESKSSPLLFGELAKLNASTTTKLVRNKEQPSFYYLPLTGISVGGKRLAIPSGTFELQNDGSGGLIIDSGTSITYLEENGYRAVKKAFLKGMNLSAADGGDVGLDVCFKTEAGAEEVQVPKLVLHFEGGGRGGVGGDLELPAENYMVLDSSKRLLCLTLMGSKGMSILGNFQQQNIHVLYDLEKEMVSFEPARCHQL